MDFRFTDDNKRYHTLNYYNVHNFGCKVQKAVIDAGFTCPNIDGSKGSGGCIFCDGGSGYFTASSRLSVTEQFNAEKERILRKFPDAKIIAYFQAHTNTYSDTETLGRLYREALSCGAAGISAATRADCIDEEKTELLKSLGVPVTVELGLQTIHDETARKINRCHTFAEFIKGYEMLKSKGIRVCVHIMNGLPDESTEMMAETVRVLGMLKPDGVKIHLLHVIRGTCLAEMYNSGKYIPMTKDEYIGTVVRQLELLPQETVIERITGDGDKSKLLAPDWSRDKISVLGGIDKRMKELDTWQGRKYEN